MEDRAYLRAARARLVQEMDHGASWEEAVATAGLLVSRATAYRLWLRAWREGPSAFEDARHGHPAKVLAPQKMSQTSMLRRSSRFYTSTVQR